MIRYTLYTPAPGAARILAIVDGPPPIGDTLPDVVAAAVSARWPGARVEAAWIGWVVYVGPEVAASIDYAPAPEPEDPRQVGLFGH